MIRCLRVLAAIVAPIIWIGVHPDPLLRRIEPTVSMLVHDVHERAEVATPEAEAARAEGESRTSAHTSTGEYP